MNLFGSFGSRVLQKLRGFRKIGISGWLKLGLITVISIFILVFLRAKIEKSYQFWDSDEDRGAIAIDNDRFGETFSKPVYLEQGWDASQSLWFYNVTQGSGMLPYDFFMVLEQKDSQSLFRENENMNGYRYLPQKVTFSNPDGLPVGLVKDTYQGKEYIGFTCAACHTNQINYKGKAIRIDGGPAMADMNNFMVDLEKALLATKDSTAKSTRFVKAVLDRNGFDKIIMSGRNYSSEKEVTEDLDVYTNRIRSYNTINHSGTKYGYARLDAFGRIYNRVLEHVLTRDDLAKVLTEVLEPEQAKDIIAGIDEDIIGNEEFDHLLEKMEKLMVAKKIRRRTIIDIRNKIFIKADAPVSYPFLWDIAQHDYVQWNGIASNAGVGPIGRNTGEVIGVFGILDWQRKPGWTLSSLISGQGFSDSHISYQSSVNVRNLRHIEDQLKELQSPQWPGIFPKIKPERAAKGNELFAKFCSSCHEDIDRSAADRRVIAQMIKLKTIGTDRKMAENSVNYVGYSGIVRGLSLGVGVGKLYIQEKAPVAALLTATTTGVVATPDADKWKITRAAEWIYDLVAAYFTNDVKATIKRGNYNPDTTVDPFASLSAYKARPLNGIWATAPYLHNGSVPTLYDLLLPKKRDKDPEDGEYRPDRFTVGHREFDPEKVGFITVKSDDRKLLFETHRKGNSNAGHEYHARKLTKEERMALVEYMKTL